jgi:antitoxin component YwqK of YwqJK toxin-antitoxin module
MLQAILSSKGMKRTLIILILIIFYECSYGQQIILITKNRDTYYEEYTVLQSDKKIKHGNYTMLKRPLLGTWYSIETIGNYSNGQKDGYWETYYEGDNNIKDKGFYKNGLRDSVWVFFYREGISRKPTEVHTNGGVSLQVVGANPVVSKTGKYKGERLVGVWEFFDASGEINQRYDYDRHAMIYLKGQDTINCEAAFIGGDFFLNQYLYDQFDLAGLMKSINTKIDLKTGKIVFKFVIDENGKINGITEVERTINNKKIYVRALESIQSMDSKWYPKRMNQNPQSSQRTITFDLNVESSTTFSTFSNDGSHRTSLGFQLKIKVD